MAMSALPVVPATTALVLTATPAVPGAMDREPADSAGVARGPTPPRTGGAQPQTQRGWGESGGGTTGGKGIRSPVERGSLKAQHPTKTQSPGRAPDVRHKRDRAT